MQARVKARKLVARVLTDLLRVQQGLAQPVPSYRKNAQPPARIVRRHRRDVEAEGVEDFQVSMPTWAAGVTSENAS